LKHHCHGQDHDQHTQYAEHVSVQRQADMLQFATVQSSLVATFDAEQADFELDAA
jgi:hypothetical protein